MKGDVTLTNLSVAFSGRRVLGAVNARFAAGAVSVLVGRSGSGKTTLLRAVNRLNEEFAHCATSGHVEVDFGYGPRAIYAPDNGGFSLPNLRLRVGMLFQTPNCFPVSVYRNIAMPLELVAGAPQKAIRPEVESALERVGLLQELHGRLNAPALSLSGGQQQRLCLARLLALEPTVLLLDEPTASLDVHAAGQIESLVRSLAERYTVIMVSHSIRQALRLADRLFVCAGGAIKAAFGRDALPDEQTLAALLHTEG